MNQLPMLGLRELTIVGYKSIRELREFPLQNLNVLIGANGAGKSNFLGIFNLLNAVVENKLKNYVQIEGGPDSILHFGRSTTDSLSASFHFAQKMYYFELTPTKDNLLFTSKEGLRTTDKNNNPEERVRAALNQLRTYHFHDTSDKARVKQQHPVNDNLRLKPDAANLAPYLRMLREKHALEYQRIVDTVRLVAPFFDDFVYRSGAQSTVELEWLQQGNPDTPFKAHALSDGTLRFICLATLLLQPIALLPGTILIDEPELGLHPYAIAVLADIFRQVSQERQLIVSTQSVELVNALVPEDIIVVDSEDGASTFKRYTQELLAGWLEQYALGELWQKNVLGGRP
jgi:predicted ATPase